MPDILIGLAPDISFILVSVLLIKATPCSTILFSVGVSDSSKVISIPLLPLYLKIIFNLLFALLFTGYGLIEIPCKYYGA
jgi:hypothetical protein